MTGTVSDKTLIFIIVNMALGVLVPLAGCIFLKKMKGCSLKSFFVGAGIMLVFALVLEQLFHAAVFSTSVGKWIQGNTVAIALYGGFAAAVFEETGRFVAFKYILKNHENDGNALMYGFGHGGFEMCYLLTFGMLNNLLLVLAIRSGDTSSITASLSGDKLAAAELAIEQLSSAEPLTFLWAPLERLSAMTAQVSLSVLVWFAVKRGGKSIWLYPLAMALHMLLDSYAAVSSGWNVSVNTIELMVLMLAFGYALLAKGVWPQPDELENVNKN